MKKTKKRRLRAKIKELERSRDLLDIEIRRLKLEVGDAEIEGGIGDEQAPEGGESANLEGSEGGDGEGGEQAEGGEAEAEDVRLCERAYGGKMNWTNVARELEETDEIIEGHLDAEEDALKQASLRAMHGIIATLARALRAGLEEEGDG